MAGAAGSSGGGIKARVVVPPGPVSRPFSASAPGGRRPGLVLKRCMSEEPAPVACTSRTRVSLLFPAMTRVERLAGVPKVQIIVKMMMPARPMSMMICVYRAERVDGVCR